MSHRYTVPQAKAAIEKALRPYKRCRVCFCDDCAVIYNSADVRSAAVRMRVCRILAQTERCFSRSAENMSSEWLMHNLAYRLHVQRGSARHVNIDYHRDRRPAVRICTGLLQLFRLH